MKAEVTYTYYSKQFDIICEATGDERQTTKTIQGDNEEEEFIMDPEYQLKVIKDGQVIETADDLIQDELAGEFNRLKSKHILSWT